MSCTGALDDWSDCLPWRSEQHWIVSLFCDASKRSCGGVLFKDGRREKNAGKKAEIMILPLSINDETTTSGTASILQNYSKEFGPQCERSSNYIPKDHITGKFNLSAAREGFLFYQDLKYHHEEMKVFRKTPEDKDKHITDEQGEDFSDSVHDSDSEVAVRHHKI